jgi:hypothetical protein
MRRNLFATGCAQIMWVGLVATSVAQTVDPAATGDTARLMCGNHVCSPAARRGDARALAEFQKALASAVITCPNGLPPPCYPQGYVSNAEIALAGPRCSNGLPPPCTPQGYVLLSWDPKVSRLKCDNRVCSPLTRYEDWLAVESGRRILQSALQK